MKKLFPLILFFLSSCSPLNQGTLLAIRFSDGTTGEVTIEAVSESKKDRILNVGFTQDKIVLKESEANKQVQEIWEKVKAEAEKEEIDEGLIKYIYLSDFDEKEQKPVYGVLLFEAARTESGSWTIRRVN